MRLLTAAVLAWALVATATASTYAPPARGTILFSTTRSPDLHDEVYVLDVRTGTRRNVSRNPTDDREPTPSPDGSSLAFVSDRNGAEAIWLAEGNAPLRRLAGPYPEGPGKIVRLESPLWSPKGDLLAFHVQRLGRGTARREIWIVGSDGRSRRRIFPSAGGEAAWSPDGRRLAGTHANFASGSVRDLQGRVLLRFAGSVAGWSRNGELAVVDRGKVGVVGRQGKITRSIPGHFARWSPDGALLAAQMQRGIGVLDPAGATRFRKPGLSLSLWSPDSRSLLAHDAKGRLLRITLDGKTSVVASQASPIGWNTEGRLALQVGREVVVRGAGGARRFALPQRGGHCPGFGKAVSWLDRNRLVYEFGSGGQQTAGLWVADSAGTSVRPFAQRDDRWAAAPSWSPAGDRVVYEDGTVLTHGGGCNQEQPQLRLVAADGSGGRVLTDDARGTSAFNPRWSPDGRYIAFERRSLSEESDFGIFVVDTTGGTAERRVSTGFGSLQSWAPDGLSVVFEAGGTLRRVVVATGAASSLGSGRSPEVAPSQPLVGFVRGDALWTVALDGSSPRRLVTIRQRSAAPYEADVQETPRWSPNSRRLAIADARGIVVVDRVTGVSRLVDAPGARAVEWSPDGRALSFARAVGTYSRLSFNSHLWARTELYVVPAGGGEPRRLTRDFANVSRASWRP